MSANRPPYLAELGELVRSQGEVTVALGEHQITLDLAFSHERGYAAKQLLNIRHPQSDIDSALFDTFVQSGDRVLDAGANIGFTALECLNAGAASVIAVEPVPELFDRLQQLGDPRLVTINAAISDTRGRAPLFLSQSHNQGSSLKLTTTELFPQVFGSDIQQVEVEQITLDDIFDRHGPCDIWKLDIEGAETDALKGARQSLQRQPPRMIIVELFEPYFVEFHALVSITHPHAYRAYLDKRDYQLVLGPADLLPLDGTCYTSPMYLYMQSPVRPGVACVVGR